jgi:PAS domain S-box-containing protein/diguanylate cyclase (GGDEF)-like protein
VGRSAAIADEARRHFDVAFDDAPIGMALFDLDGEYVRVNRSLCELLGRTPDELIGVRDQALTHPDDRAADLAAVDDVFAGRMRTFQCEKRFVRPDGEIVWVLANLTFLRDDDGEPLSWVGQFQDITARRAAEEALRESERRHRLVVRNLPGAGLVLYDRELRCLLIEGRHMEDAIPSGYFGKPMREVVTPEILALLEPAALLALEGERSTFETFSNTTQRYVTAEIVPHQDDDGTIAGVLVSVRDVTEQRAAEQTSRDAEERFRIAFENAPIGIALVGTDGRWMRVNDKLCAMLGYDKEELLASTFQAITHPDDLDNDLEQVRRMLAGEMRSYEIEKRYFRGDGTTVWILLSVSLARGEDGEPLYFVSQLQDIDERKRAMGELEHHAHHDALTGLLNRRAWDSELEHAIAHGDGSVAIVLIDLNDFKQVNDTLGHAAGDDLLRAAAGAWRAHLRDGDRLARLGGDEFAVLLTGAGAQQVSEIVVRLRRGLAHGAGAAIGVAHRRTGEDATSLMRRADAALYADKI